MHTARAFGAGVIGALVLSGLMAWMRVAGLPIHLEERLAEMFGLHAWIVGFIAYLVFGGIVGLVYGGMFEVINQAGIGPGLLFGGIHSIFAGFIWAMVNGPGRFWWNFGPTGVSMLFLLHLIFGAIVGLLYRPVHVLQPELPYPSRGEVRA